VSLNASVHYEILGGNEGGYFELEPETGRLFLIRQVDRESLPSPTFALQLKAKQKDDPAKFGLARVLVRLKNHKLRIHHPFRIGAYTHSTYFTLKYFHPRLKSWTLTTTSLYLKTSPTIFLSWRIFRMVSQSLW
jgi:hypothetical protein